jgi:hypothetical protein
MKIPPFTLKARINGLWSEEKLAIYYESVMSVIGHLGMLQSIVKFGVVEARIIRLFVQIAMTEGPVIHEEVYVWGLIY